MIKKIVLTGGPGSGKTSVIESIQKNFGGRYRIIVSDESASHIMRMGIRPFGDDPINLIDFQELVVKLQIQKEELFERAIESLEEKDTIIIYDRGLMDNLGYINIDEFKEVVDRVNPEYKISNFLDRYDLILNLVSREDFYTKDNNPERIEDVDYALELGQKTLKGWLGHKNLKIVFPKDDFNDKIKEVLNYINNVLKEPEIKRQEKYYVNIKETDLEYLKEISTVAHIEQSYLESDENIEKRVRKTNLHGADTYTYTIHETKEDGKKYKVSEKSISEKIYNDLLEYKDKNKRTIIKDRYYFTYENKYYTLDLIDDYGLLEINILEDEKVMIPPFICAIDRVTDNELFLNKNIANKNSKEFTKTNIS